jgi:hypothetical protein
MSVLMTAFVGQVGSRAERMGLQGSKHLYLYSATRLVDILQEIVAMQPRAVVIDSIQTVYLDDVSGSAGSVSQVRPHASQMITTGDKDLTRQYGTRVWGQVLDSLLLVCRCDARAAAAHSRAECCAAWLAGEGVRHCLAACR